MKSSISSLLSDNGIRPSTQRVSILAYLAEHHTHPTADEVFEALRQEIPNLSRTTVDNTLRLMVSKNLIHTVVIDRLNVRYDFNTRRHAHFRCRHCGQMLDLGEPQDMEDLFPLPENWIVERTQVYFSGLCAKCVTGE